MGKFSGEKRLSSLVYAENQYNPQRKSSFEKDICTPMFTVALCTIARTWKQPKCPLMDEWIKKMWYMSTLGYYSAIKQ